MNDNDGVEDPEEYATVEVCDGGTYSLANLVHSSSANRYAIAVTPSGGVLLFNGSPASNGDISSAQFDGAQGMYTITLSNPATGGSIVQVITPYNDVNGNSAFDTEVDCYEDPITITYIANPIPALQTTINSVQVTSNNDGSDDVAAFEVCHAGSDNLFFTQFDDLAGAMPTALVKVQQEFIRTNVTFAPTDGTYPLSDYATPFSRTVSRINPGIWGSLEMRFRAFFDMDDDNAIDDGECVGDWIIYNVSVDLCSNDPEVFEDQTDQSNDPDTEVVKTSQRTMHKLHNYPNPFHERTTVVFVLDEACEAVLSVFDARGQLLFNTQADYAAGKHEVEVDLSGSTMNGALYYQLTTPLGKMTGKMVRLGE
ncbi:MAG: T9SS type A sorting domain-containing protein [Saprospirales bacterium]|nr:T9SS type A sorting domain-containing protein [Saprospirales bacterium]